MAIPNNTSVKLGVSVPKKDAVVAQPGTAAGANDIRILAGTGIDETRTQNIVGALTKLHRFAQTILHTLSGVADPDVLHTVLGGSDNDIVVNGTPGVGDVVLEIGTFTGAGDRSHFLDRTFKRVVERWLEESK